MYDKFQLEKSIVYKKVLKNKKWIQILDSSHKDGIILEVTFIS